MAENSVNTIDYEKIYDSNNYGQFKFLEEIPTRFFVEMGIFNKPE